MKRLALFFALIILIVVIVLLRPLSQRYKFQVPSSKLQIATTTPPEIPAASPEDEVRALQQTVGNFLTAVKDPYRPPLGDNEDITKAMTGGNRYGNTFIPTNDARIVDGKIVDRWGTPYFFHNRAPDAIDVRSAGPDRILFTEDDVTNQPAP